MIEGFVLSDIFISEVRNASLMSESKEVENVESLDKNPVDDHFSLDDAEHMAFRNYMRDLILGANDGLISVFALVIGVASGVSDISIVRLAGIAGLVAGAISMAIGEYVSTKSQEQVYDAEKRIEKQHIDDYFDHERGELCEWYRKKGFEGELLEQMVDVIASDPKIMLDEMMMAEFGVIEEERRSPLLATLMVGIAFVLGSSLPVIPFFFVSSMSSGILISTILSFMGLFSVGGAKSYVTQMSVFRGGMENLILGALGALITYGIGSLVGA